MFGLPPRTAIGILALNSVVGFCYTVIVFWVVSRYKNVDLMDEFITGLAQAHWSVWLMVAGIFLATGNLIPALWLLLAFRDAPGRPRAAQLVAVTTVAMAVAGVGYMLLFRTFANPMRSTQATDLALDLLAWSGLWVMQLIGAVVVEIADRTMRWRRGRRGACIACGYLQRTPADRCPECGEQTADL